MFSSRIIKGVTLEERRVASYSFATLENHDKSSAATASDGFEPFIAEQQQDRPVQQNSATDKSTALSVNEEALQQMLNESSERGRIEGRQQAEAAFAATCRALSEAIAEVDGLREKILTEAEDDLLRLSALVAKQVIQHEVSLDRNILVRFVSEALREITDQEIMIHFNPEDYRTVNSNRNLYLGATNDKRQITIKSDDSVSPGGCLIDTTTGQVDTRIETQLAEIYRRLLQEKAPDHEVTTALPSAGEAKGAIISGPEKYAYVQN